MPLVSVILPTYNRAGSIGAAIRSVLDQTERDFEIIVVDDRSTDETEDVVKRFGDPRIRYIRQARNGGDAASRNAGVLESRGKYLAFLDDDDEWLPEKLSLQLPLFERGGERVGLVHGGRQTIVEATGQTVLMLSEGSPEEQLRWFRITTSAVMVRRAAVDEVGLFDESIVFCSDCDLWIRLWRAGYEFQAVDRPIVRYHIHPDGLSGSLGKVVTGTEILLRKHESFFADHPASYGEHLQELGVRYFASGEAGRARAAFARSVRVHPQWKNCGYLVLSLLGGRLYPWIPRVRKWLIAHE
jgi:glycosyltransferase involved in cell wall biosynthesis